MELQDEQINGYQRQFCVSILKVIIRGVFGDPHTGSGELRDEQGDYIKPPTIRDDITNYEC